MDPSEANVLRQLPGLHSYISNNFGVVDWELISQDLAKLEWLASPPVSIGDIITSVWEIIDRSAVAKLNEASVFNVLSLNRVVLYLKNLTHHLCNATDEARAICYSCKKSASSLQFFQHASIVIRNAEEDELVSVFTTLNQIYIELRATVGQVFSELERIYNYEMYKGLKKALDDYFYTQVLAYHRIKLSYYPKARELLQRYDSKTYKTTSYNKNQIFATVTQGVINGFGRASYHNGDSYEGAFELNKRHGKGVYFWKDGSRYEGDFEDNKMSGKGTRHYASGSVYTGDFVEGKKHGTGSLNFVNGDNYTGQWEYDDMSGSGTYTWATGDAYSGRFELDERVGKGTLVLKSGEVYEAEWSDGKMVDRFQ